MSEILTKRYSNGIKYTGYCMSGHYVLKIFDKLYKIIEMIQWELFQASYYFMEQVNYFLYQWPWMQYFYHMLSLAQFSLLYRQTRVILCRHLHNTMPCENDMMPRKYSTGGIPRITCYLTDVTSSVW